MGKSMWTCRWACKPTGSRVFGARVGARLEPSSIEQRPALPGRLSFTGSSGFSRRGLTRYWLELAALEALVPCWPNRRRNNLSGRGHCHACSVFFAEDASPRRADHPGEVTAFENAIAEGDAYSAACTIYRYGHPRTASSVVRRIVSSLVDRPLRIVKRKPAGARLNATER